MKMLEAAFCHILSIDEEAGTFWARIEHQDEPDQEGEFIINKIPKRDLVGVTLKPGVIFVWVLFKDDAGKIQSKFIFNYLGYWKEKDIAEVKRRAEEMYNYLNMQGD